MRHPFPALSFRPTTADGQAGRAKKHRKLMVPVNGTRRMGLFVEERGTQVHFCLSASGTTTFSDQSAMSRPNEEMNGWISGIRVREDRKGHYATA
jgi:hypothetical protein